MDPAVPSPSAAIATASALCHRHPNGQTRRCALAWHGMRDRRPASVPLCVRTAARLGSVCCGFSLPRQQPQPQQRSRRCPDRVCAVQCSAVCACVGARCVSLIACACCAVTVAPQCALHCTEPSRAAAAALTDPIRSAAQRSAYQPEPSGRSHGGRINRQRWRCKANKHEGSAAALCEQMNCLHCSGQTAGRVRC